MKPGVYLSSNMCRLVFAREDRGYTVGRPRQHHPAAYELVGTVLEKCEQRNAGRFFSLDHSK